ncbi:glycosyltransferase family 2 protein [Pluralibacter gergoviae]|uniref:glycosyltransferase family 2 protein n=1 Tax=Pluralibacter gergoviae TaxID=61647 RepID=UPI000A58D83A|nr:glycosyltransferase family 2 protein [Pluralibacter gergoviae]
MQEIVSIIMPAYNAEKTISDSIRSVLEQSYTNYILYIINDASTDNTDKVIKTFDDKRIIYLSNSVNQGVALSRNNALKICKGKYISFLDSDDTWSKNKLELQVEKLTSGWDLVCSNYEVFTDDHKIINKRRFPEVITFGDMLKSNYIGNLTGIYNAEKTGVVYQQKKGHEDYIMWLSIIKKTKSAYCIQDEIAQYRISKNSLSANKFNVLKWQWDIYRNILRFSFLKSSYYFIFYVFNGIMKRV